MNRTRLSLALAATLALAGAARATTYDLVSSFSSTSSSGVFSYGTGVTGLSFTPYTNFNPDCLGAGTACWQTAAPDLQTPTVTANLSGSTINYGSVVIPTDVLLVHPGRDTDSIVRFTAPTTGIYAISGLTELLDTSPTGVIVSAFINGLRQGSLTLTAPGATHPASPGEALPIGPASLTLNAGDVLDIGVNNDGNFYNDSTGVALTLTTPGAAAPEPASWALMLVGLGGLSASLRSTRRRGFAPAA